MCFRLAYILFRTRGRFFQFTDWLLTSCTNECLVTNLAANFTDWQYRWAPAASTVGMSGSSE